MSSYLADFSKLDNVYRFVEEIKRDFQRIDILFNNAGLYAGKERKASGENVELTFMLSVLVPYIFITELIPLLEKLPLRKNTIPVWPTIIPSSTPFG